MNLRYRLGQIKNTLFRPSGPSSSWAFVYGVPRSGTTYFYHALLTQARLGVSDFDLGRFIPAIKHIESSGYIPIDTQALKHFFKEQLQAHGAPGGGSRWDFVIKQVNTSGQELELYTELIGGPPSAVYFLYREPSAWLPSAMKKYGIGQDEATAMYANSLDAFAQIGGEVIEYGPEITQCLANIGIHPREGFTPPERESSPAPEAFQELYRRFQSNLD
jgi:hypothetical protein